METFIDAFEQAFSCKPAVCEEKFMRFSANATVTAENIPKANRIEDFLSFPADTDEMSIEICDAEKNTSIFSIRKNLFDPDEYNRILGEYECSISVRVTISKQPEKGVIPIYCVKAFTDHLLSQELSQLLQQFSSIVKESKNKQIIFMAIGEIIQLKSSEIVISNDSVEPENTNHEEKCERNGAACTFLNRIEMPLLPEDFDVTINTGTCNQELTKVFTKLRNILSYLYIASYSYIYNGKAVLQISQTHNPHEYSMEEISNADVGYEIYKWAYSNNDYLDRITIARNVIGAYCKNETDYLKLNTDTLLSIKTNYNLFTKRLTDQYLQMKKEIADFINSSSIKVLEISRNLMDALKENVLGMIGFVVATLLTKSTLTDPKSFVLIGTLLFFMSIGFLTIVQTRNQKEWDWIEESYAKLKNNYKDLFNDQDLERAFNHDEALNAARSRYEESKHEILTIWWALIFVVFVFVIIMASIVWNMP